MFDVRRIGRSGTLDERCVYSSQKLRHISSLRRKLKRWTSGSPVQRSYKRIMGSGFRHRQEPISLRTTRDMREETVISRLAPDTSHGADGVHSTNGELFYFGVGERGSQTSRSIRGSEPG